MKPKHKALLFNFISFCTLFLVARVIVYYTVHDNNSTGWVFASAFFATVISPKFFVMKIDGGKESVMMKILFVKQPKRVGK